MKARNINMATWSLSTRYKKSVEERMIFTHTDGRTIEIVHGYRWCKFTTESDTKPVIETEDENGSYNVYDDPNHDWEMEFLDDGWYFDIAFPDSVSEEEREVILDAWHEASFEGLEELGWIDCGETELILSGPLDLENESE